MRLKGVIGVMLAVLALWRATSLANAGATRLERARAVNVETIKLLMIFS